MIKYLKRKLYIKRVNFKKRVMSEVGKKEYDSVLLKGSSKEVEFSNGGHVQNHSVNVQQLVKILEWYNEERGLLGLEPTEFLSFTTKSRKTKDDYGNTHYNVFQPWFPKSKGKTEGKADTAEVTDKLPWE
jgi:hypothetical protein